MYVPAAFKETRLEVLHALIRAHSFGTLVSHLDGELFATHLPFVLDAEHGACGTLLGHMARANPHWRAFGPSAPIAARSVADGPQPALVMFQGPHAYISPSWYVTQQSVPTWNYTAVHVYGQPRLIEDADRVRRLLDATVHTYESGLPEPWTTARVSDDYLAGMARSIVAFELPIARLEGKRKLGQNRPAADIAGAAAGLRAHSDALGQAVAELMDPLAQEDTR